MTKGFHAEAEHQQDDRVERDLRDRIQRNEHRLHRLRRQPMQPQRESDQQPEHDGDRERGCERLQRVFEMQPEEIAAQEVRRVAQRLPCLSSDSRPGARARAPSAPDAARH